MSPGGLSQPSAGSSAQISGESKPCWQVRGGSSSAIPSDSWLAKQNFPPGFSEFLWARGIHAESVYLDLLDFRLQRLADPTTLLGLNVAVDRLLLARQRQEALCVYADFDLDGTCGAALLREGLLQLGFKEVSIYQPRRLRDGYGMHPEAMEAIAKSNAKVIVTVDVGITAVAAVEKANQLGLEVIITDHHLPGDVLPRAVSVVNPNQAGCSSGLGYLSGAGVAFYLLRGLARRLHQSGESEAVSSLDLKSLLDLLAIASITDLVPLEKDNRVLVRHGLEVLRHTKRPGLRTLLENLKVGGGKALTAQEVGIRIAPKLNALSRMDGEILPLDLLLVEDPQQARDLVGRSLSSNQERVNLQAEGEKEALEQLKVWQHQEFSFVASPNFHKGVIGLIATRLAGSLQKPSFVGSISDGKILGSARGAAGISALEGLRAAASALERFGGHDMACGFVLNAERVNEFQSLLADHYFSHAAQTPVQLFDVSIDLADVTEDLLIHLDRLAPYGVGLPSPLWATFGVQIESVKELTGGHLRWTLLANSGSRLTALQFSPRIMVKAGDRVDILYELMWNEFRGTKSLQMLIKEVRPSLPPGESYA